MNNYNNARIESQNYGHKVEEIFYQYAIKNGTKIRHASEHENMKKHIDFFLTSKDGKEYSVDVKGMKKINRHDQSRQDEWLFIEFKNVLGNNGWLYGHADYIAFETSVSFIFVLRTDLISICDKLVDKTSIAHSSQDCAYRVYTRKDRRDLVSMIKLSDIPKELTKVWRK
jgi:hypothetical protein